MCCTITGIKKSLINLITLFTIFGKVYVNYMKKFFTRSIGFRIVFFYILLVLINVSFVITVIFENQVDLIAVNAKLESEKQFYNLIDSIKKFSSEMGKGSLFTGKKDQKISEHFIEVISTYASAYYVINEKDKILYQSKTQFKPPDTLDEDVLRAITTKNFSGKEYYLRIDDKNKIVYCYIPLDDFQPGNTILLVVKDISSLDLSLQYLYKQALFVIIITLFFHAVFVLLLFRYIIRPVKLLDLSAKKISEGDFKARVLLLETAKIISRNCAETDIVSRFHSDKFVILSPDCSTEYAGDLSEKIKNKIESNTVITPDGTFAVTASIGVSFSHSREGKALESEQVFMQSAEAALQQAKKKGKNKVEILS